MMSLKAENLIACMSPLPLHGWVSKVSLGALAKDYGNTIIVCHQYIVYRVTFACQLFQFINLISFSSLGQDLSAKFWICMQVGQNKVQLLAAGYTTTKPR